MGRYERDRECHNGENIRAQDGDDERNIEQHSKEDQGEMSMQAKEK